MVVEIILRSFVPLKPSRMSRLRPNKSVGLYGSPHRPRHCHRSAQQALPKERTGRYSEKASALAITEPTHHPEKTRNNDFNDTCHRIAHHQVWRPFTRGRHADRVVWTSFFSGQDSQNEERQAEKTIFPAAHPARDDLRPPSFRQSPASFRRPVATALFEHSFRSRQTSGIVVSG